MIIRVDLYGRGFIQGRHCKVIAVGIDCVYIILID